MTTARIDVAWARLTVPTVNGAFRLRPLPGGFTVAGHAAEIKVTSKRMVAEGAAFTVTGQASNALRSRIITSRAAATATITGQPVRFRGALARLDVSLAYLRLPQAPYKVLPAETGLLAVTGFAADLRRTVRIRADAGFFAANPFPARVLYARRFGVEGAAVEGVGFPVAWSVGYAINAEAGGFAVNAQPNDLRASRRLLAEGATLELVGADVRLRKARGYTIQGEVAGVTVTGQPAEIVRRYTLVAAGAAFSVTARPASLRTGRRISADVTSIGVVGQGASVRLARKLSGAVGTFSVIGSDARVRVTASEINAGGALIIVAGRDIRLRAARVMTAAPASFSVAGLPAAHIVAKRRTAFPLLIGPG